MRDPIPSTLDALRTLRDYFAETATPASDTDDLLELANRFVGLKQRLGHRYEKEGRILRGFVRFLHDRGIAKASDLSVEAMLAWAATRVHVQLLTWNGELGAVSVFMDHLKALGKIRNNLCWFLKKRYRSNFRAYIFGVDELRRIFTPPKNGTVDQKRRAFIYLVIYAAGLRVSEASRLQIRDLDLETGTIFIRKSKWDKERLLPLHPRLLKRLRSYLLEVRQNASPDDVLFVNSLGQPYLKGRLTNDFRDDLRRLGLYRPTHEADGVRYGSPRIHALRHSFAVHRLLKWYREGVDVQAMLPFLSTYLGHAQVEYSQVYLQATGLVLREAHERFAGRWEKQFPLSP